MDSWCLYLRDDVMGWKWYCYDDAGNLMCWSERGFRRMHLAMRDFELRLEDHRAQMAHRYSSAR